MPNPFIRVFPCTIGLTFVFLPQIRYINLDAGVWEKGRSEDGKIQANAQRFPSGLAALSASLRSKGLKLGKKLCTLVHAKALAQHCRMLPIIRVNLSPPPSLPLPQFPFQTKKAADPFVRPMTHPFVRRHSSAPCIHHSSAIHMKPKGCTPI